ncbi:hypothetical protein M405DRAFT_78342 [Rhizopogon salebrosus TDB-379]|nr:hypothetical protein M405DRAFT_78342 [Rhizopogon salebrosus TDB-379]
MAFDFRMLMYGTMQVGIRMAHPQAICAFTYVLATRHGLAGMLLFYFAITAAGSSLDEVANPCKLYPVRPTVTCASESTFKRLCDAGGDKPQNDIINDIITLAVQCSPRTQFSKSPWWHVVVLLRMMHCIARHLCFLFHSRLLVSTLGCA